MRPAVDVVIPFRGTPSRRAEVLARMRGLDLAAGDTMTLVDNGAQVPDELGRDPALIHAPERPTSYYARNRGAQRGTNPWIVFLDADVVPQPGLLDGYFAAPVGDEVGVLAGGVRDEQPASLDGLSAAARYAATRAPMAHEITLQREWSYAQTANAAFRRSAFEAAGGFDERPRSGGDADLCFRLRRAGWTLESRPAALVVHRNRTTLRALLRQRARHGSGAAWLQRRHPGSFPPRRRWLRWILRCAWRIVRSGLAARRGDRAAALELVDVACAWAFDLGRLLPNQPRPRR